ncbi:hypothetical protein, conserved [Leishmania lindenbergi]|uniref:Uncharacterized protein n=1 Tax=Leishmania lindenbergi TaxID=651832 RepID=A0AAW3ASL8_9TRYP
MGTGTGCLYACAPFTLIVSILLFMLSAMLHNGNWTFAVLAAKHKWDTSAKSRSCRNGGILYLFISVVLWALVLADSFLIQLEDLPTSASKWWRQRRLPSLQELIRKRRKASEAEGAGTATDVIVMTPTPVAAVRTGAAKSPQRSSLLVLPPSSAKVASSPNLVMTSGPVTVDDSRGKASSTGPVRGDAGCAGFTLSYPSPLAVGGSLIGDKAVISSAKALSSAGRPYESVTSGAVHAHSVLPVSTSTSAATSILEGDYLLP